VYSICVCLHLINAIILVSLVLCMFLNKSFFNCYKPQAAGVGGGGELHLNCHHMTKDTDQGLHIH